MMEIIEVKYQGEFIAALSYDSDSSVHPGGLGYFEYDSAWIKKGIQLSPLHMPLSKRIYSFAELPTNVFRGLPGMIADSLPDDFGNAVLNAWIATKGRNPGSITPLERLQYTGLRGMGALEYVPSKNNGNGKLNSPSIALNELVKVAQEVIDHRNSFEAHLGNGHGEDAEAMHQLLQVGMSAGGARPKAILAFNSDLTVVRSGQVEVPEGFTHYLMKFDGVSEHNKSSETFGDPLGFGAMEYVYYLMAKQAGITMEPCFLLNEGERRHFLTRRFDRFGNRKVHVQTLTGMAHVTFKEPGTFSYHELFLVLRDLKLPFADASQLVRRMIFNIVARNHDDHPKNFAFLMSDEGKWSLAPAYDIAYSYKPGSPWVNSHYMSLNGKRDNFSLDDIMSIRSISPRFTSEYIGQILQEVIESVSDWPKLAAEHGVPVSLINMITPNLRLKW